MFIESVGATESGLQAMSWNAKVTEGLPSYQLRENSAVLSDDRPPSSPGTRRGRLDRHRGDRGSATWATRRRRADFPIIDGCATASAATRALRQRRQFLFLGAIVCINTGGEKVFAEEVERVVKSHPAIYDALVVGIPSQRWGSR